LRPRYLGDSFDIVKQSLLRWLQVFGTWEAHPMFTERVTPEKSNAFSRLLGIPLLSTDTLEAETNREAYFALARSCQHHLFLDPDTGLRFSANRTNKPPSYLFGSEAVSIVSGRPNRLTLVFDQALARGREREQLAEKMAFLGDHTIASLAYFSHASFILMSKNQELIKKASEAVQDASRLPSSRFLVGIDR